MIRWPRNAAGVSGTDVRARYAGAATVTRRTAPTRVADSDESGSSPIRTATSIPSSIRSTTRSTNSAFARTAGKASR